MIEDGALWGKGAGRVREPASTHGLRFRDNRDSRDSQGAGIEEDPFYGS